MTRQKNQFPSERVRLDGFQRMPITDPRVQKAYDWYLDQKRMRRAFPMAWALLVKALNGELGSEIQQAVEAGAQDTQEALEALDDLLGAYLS